MMRPLTPKEKSVLEFIENYLKSNGYSPSFLEIKDAFGFASFNSVQRYLKQLQNKEYIHIPGGNQKRAISVLKTANSIQSSLQSLNASLDFSSMSNSEPFVDSIPMKGASLISAGYHQNLSTESLSLPLLGRVAAGQPLEAYDHDSFVDVPRSLVRIPQKSFALTVEGQSMVEDGILDGDVILVQDQKVANNGQIAVATIDNEATVKRIYLHKNKNQIELRPSNSNMSSMWYAPNQVDIRGIVVGLIRHYY